METSLKRTRILPNHRMVVHSEPWEKNPAISRKNLHKKGSSAGDLKPSDHSDSLGYHSDNKRKEIQRKSRKTASVLMEKTGF